MPQDNLRAVILTALPVEYLAVRAYLRKLREEAHPRGTVYERGSFDANGQVWDVGLVEIGAGNLGAALEAERAIDYFNPEVILFVGVAGGIKDVQLGDVVVSTKIYGYEFSKAVQAFRPRPEMGLADYSLQQRARAEARKTDWRQRLVPVPDPAPRVFVAPIAVGEKVIASTESEVFQFLRSHYGDAVAVEMEGFGVLEAARANPRVSAIVIRGISDLIEGKTEADRAGSQERAARHASAFAFQLLANFVPNDLLTNTSTDPEQPQEPHETLSILRNPRRLQCFTEPAIQLDLMLIPGGTFMMGSPPDELGQWEDERPQHEVTVSTFLMGRYPVTQAQWRAIATRADLKVNHDLEPEPSNFEGENHPVENVSWEEAVEFCDRLSRLTHHTYRLPTEAEWEYACRAGTTTPFHFGETITTDLANYRGEDNETDPEKYPGHYGSGPKGEYRQSTTPVTYFHPLANAFGLCDMHGNVWEWCLDHWHNNYERAPTDGGGWLAEPDRAGRVVRGGAWGNNPWDCRSACRSLNNPGDRDDDIGFRVVCEVRGL